MNNFIGVKQNNGLYEAEIVLDNKIISLGTFNTPEIAALKYDCTALMEFGINAKTNFDFWPIYNSTNKGVK